MIKVDPAALPGWNSYIQIDIVTAAFIAERINTYLSFSFYFAFTILIWTF